MRAAHGLGVVVPGTAVRHGSRSHEERDDTAMPARRTTTAASHTPRRGVLARLSARPSVLLACVLGASLVLIAAAIVAASASGASASAAPACIPHTLGGSAQLGHSNVDVTPAPGSGTADPRTQLSFLGTPAADIRDLRVVGSRSGVHTGKLEAYSQGDGASFVPSAPFVPGETVTVRVVIASGRYSYSFSVDTPWSTAGVGQFPNPAAPSYDYQTFATLPGVEAPVMTVTSADRDGGAGDIFTSNGPAPGRYGAAIYAPSGRLIWFDQMSGGTVADDLNVQAYEGRPALTFWRGKVLSLGFGQGEDVILGSRYQTLATIRGANGVEPDLHEFQIAADDTAYVSAYNPIRCDLHSAGGPRDGVILDAVILDVDIRTGLVRWEWHALDHVNVNDSETSPPNTRAWDWFHLNSIDPEPNGDIFISARNTWAGYQIAGHRGVILWTLGGLDSSFRMGPGTRTAWQHDGRILSNGDVTFFDDGDPGETQSRAVTIALDLAKHSARLVSALTHDPPLLAASQGDMQTLPDGNVLVGYGGVPEISEFSPSGALLFDAHLPYGLIFYRAYRHPWSALPLQPPAAVASLNNVGETVVQMSWNGATGVRAWRVLAGQRRQGLKALARVAVSGFETSAMLTSGYRYAQVQALGANGAVLASSPVVAVTGLCRGVPDGGAVAVRRCSRSGWRARRDDGVGYRRRSMALPSSSPASGAKVGPR